MWSKTRFQPFVVFVILWIISASAVEEIRDVRVGCDSPDWRPNQCIDHPCFIFHNNEHKSCDWIAKRPGRLHCRSKNIQTLCPVACGVEECSSSLKVNSTSNRVVTPNIYPRGKKGIGFVLREDGKEGSYKENLPKMQALHPQWAYSWGANPPAGVPQTVLPDGGIEILPHGGTSPSPDGIDFVPMLWGYYPKHFEEYTDRMLDPQPRIVFGFNEPDNWEQSNISVEHALEGWDRLVSKVEANTRDDTIIVSPSCVHATDDWCKRFMQTADEQGLRVDAIGIHWYGGANAQEFLSMLRETYEFYGNRPLVVTEFAIADWKAKTVEENSLSPAKALEFMEVVLPWMEATEWILAYAWFPFKITSPPGWISALVESYDESSGDVVLTTLGQYYSKFTGNLLSPHTMIFM